MGCSGQAPVTPPDADGSRAHARGGRNGLFGIAHILEKALARYGGVPAKATGQGDELQAGSWHPPWFSLSLRHSIGGTLRLFSPPLFPNRLEQRKIFVLLSYIHSKFCAGLFSLLFFTPFQLSKQWKLFGYVNYQLNTALLTTYTEIYDELRAALLIGDKPSIL